MVENEGADDEPAAHLADEHLEGLEHGLLKVRSVLLVGRIAVADALHVLGEERATVSGDLDVGSVRAGGKYLVLSKESVADAGHQHHSNEKGNESFGCHAGGSDPTLGRVRMLIRPGAALEA